MEVEVLRREMFVCTVCTVCYLDLIKITFALFAQFACSVLTNQNQPSRAIKEIGILKKATDDSEDTHGNVDKESKDTTAGLYSFSFRLASAADMMDAASYSAESPFKPRKRSFKMDAFPEVCLLGSNWLFTALAIVICP